MQTLLQINPPHLPEIFQVGCSSLESWWMVGNFSAEDVCACIYGTGELMNECQEDRNSNTLLIWGGWHLPLLLRNSASGWEARKGSTWPVSQILPAAFKRRFLLPFLVAMPKDGDHRDVHLLEVWHLEVAMQCCSHGFANACDKKTAPLLPFHLS